MTLAEAPAARPALDGLARAARRALGCEAVLVVAHDDRDGAPAIVEHVGVEPGTLATLRRGLAAGDHGVLGREYPHALTAAAVRDGERLGAIHALGRDGESFERPELLRTFATQVALALAMARRPPAQHDGSELLPELDRLVLSVHNLEDLSHAIADALAPLFDGALSAVMVADQQRSILQMSPGAFGAPGDVAASHQVNLFDPASNSARVYLTRQPYVSNSSVRDAGIRQEYVDAFGIHRLLTVPLGRIGILHLANKPQAFTLEDLERTLALAPRIAAVVELAITLLRLRRQQRLDEILADVAVAIASGAGGAPVLVGALESLCETTDAQLLAIVPEEGEPSVALTDPAYGAHAERVIAEARTNPGVRAYVVGPQRAGDPGHAAYYVPMRLGHQRVGTLAAFRARGEPFAQAERRSLLRIATLAALSAATEGYRRQSAEIARLQERQRIADDLHDDVAQILFVAQLGLDAILQRGAVDDPVAEAITRARAMLIRGDMAIRTVIHRLSSPEPADLATRISATVTRIEEDLGLPASFTADAGAIAIGRTLSRSKSDTLVKVTRESLINAFKHAGPCEVHVRLEVTARDRLVLTVDDDGRGVGDDDAGTRHGLASLRRTLTEIGGTLSVTRGPAGGTRVTAGLPLDGGDAA